MNERKNLMNTLVMTVGTGRSRTDIAKALSFAVEYHKPQQVVLLCSPVTAEQTLPHIKPFLLDQKISFRSYTISNENNVQSLYQDYLKILQELGDPRCITVDFTSGTKAMSAALFAAAVALEVGEVSYILGPRDQTGRVVESTEVSSFCPELVFAERQLDKARMLFNKLDFYAAWELAKRYDKTLPADSPLRVQAKTIVLVSQAYDLWERFQWKRASHLLRKAANPREGLTGVRRERLEANADFTRTLAERPYGEERLFELYANAGRRLEQGRYDDALSRLYRAYEYLVQNRLKGGFDVDTSNLTLQKIEELPLSRRAHCRLHKKAEECRGPLKLGMVDAIGLLAELKDAVGIKLFEMYWGRPFRRGLSPNPQKHHGLLQNCLNQRNRSFLAHGTDPAKEETVRSMLEAYGELLKQSMAPKAFDKLSRDSVFITMER
jgi:CRISPR-associated protein (TIGR02710 family)